MRVRPPAALTLARMRVRAGGLGVRAAMVGGRGSGPFSLEGRRRRMRVRPPAALTLARMRVRAGGLGVRAAMVGGRGSGTRPQQWLGWAYASNGGWSGPLALWERARVRVRGVTLVLPPSLRRYKTATIAHCDHRRSSPTAYHRLLQAASASRAWDEACG